MQRFTTGGNWVCGIVPLFLIRNEKTGKEHYVVESQCPFFPGKWQNYKSESLFYNVDDCTILEGVKDKKKREIDNYEPFVNANFPNRETLGLKVPKLRTYLSEYLVFEFLKNGPKSILTKRALKFLEEGRSSICSDLDYEYIRVLNSWIKQMRQSYSDLIYKVLIPYGLSIGFKIVNFSNELPNDVSGRVYYDRKEIHINCAGADEAFFTMIHELGHALSYIRLASIGIKQPAPEKREQYAMQYGWKIIKELKLPVTKENWREYGK